MQKCIPNTAVTTVSSTLQETFLPSNRNFCLLKAVVANVSTSDCCAETNLTFIKILYLTALGKLPALTVEKIYLYSIISICVLDSIYPSAKSSKY